MTDARKELSLNDFGASIVRRGGHDDASDDDLLLLEIVKRAPGITSEECQKFFVSLRVEFGEDALHAIRNGHAKFEKVKK